MARAFDYAVPEELADRVRTGAIVRVRLHGRTVRGWVVAEDVESETDSHKLLPLLAFVSEGPTPELIGLTEWAAHRYSGSRVALLRAASPPNRVIELVEPARSVAPLAAGESPARSASATAADAAADELAAQARECSLAVLRWPPLLDRRRLVSGLLAEDGSTIVVTADGVRAAAFASWLERSGSRVVLLRSDDPAAARTIAWRRALAGGTVVVGGRVAALAPVPDLAAVVIVDDGDEALKEERVPAWHARDLLIERARRNGARLTVISPAPTLDTIAAVGPAISVGGVIEAAGWPRLDVVDRREEPPGAGLFSEHLSDAIRRSVNSGGNVVCVLNRRGRARLLACGACGHLVRRDRFGELVADAGSGLGGESSGRVCPACGAVALRALRSGVARVREEMEALLAHLPVGEVDSSTREIADAPVLVGTEAVLHRAEVRRRRPVMVAYLDLDQELLAPRFRAAEQALWLLVRGAHLLAGRPRSQTRLLVQTRLPDHRVVIAAAGGVVGAFAQAETLVREAACLPPFSCLAELSGARSAVDAAAAAVREAAKGDGVTVRGPTDRGTTARALVEAPDSEALSEMLTAAHRAARGLGRLRCEVDPLRV